MADLNSKLGERQKEREAAKKKAAALGAELNDLLNSEKDRKAALSGGGAGAEGEAAYRLYMTLFKYSSDDPNDLQFEAGEVLRVFDDSGDWYEGENQQGQKGTFPHNFVRKITKPSGGGSVSVGGMENSN